MADVSEVTPLQGFIAFISSGTAAAGSTATNPNGSINGIGTVVGVAQTGQGLVALGTSGQALTSVPLVGGALNIAGAGVSAQSMLNSYNQNQPIYTSDVSNLISNVASLGANVAGYLVIAAEGSAAAAIAAPLIIPLTVVSVAAGAVALVASGMGWTLGSSGQPTQVSLNAQQASQAASMVQQANADPSSIQQALANVDVDISTNSGSFLVPQFDSNGNQIGSAFLTPTTTESINGGTEYEFANGVTLTEYPDASASVAGVSNFNAVWSYPVQDETVTATEIGVNTVTGDSASAGSVSTATQTVTNSSTGVTTTTTTSNSGGQSSMSVTTSQTVDGVSTDVTTVSNNGQTLFTEDKTSSDGILTSDTISENVTQSLALNGDDVVLNGVTGDITSLIGANNTINLAYGFTGVVETGAAQINVDGNSTVTVSGSGNSVSSPLSGNAFTLDGTDDRVNASGSVIQVASNTLTDEIAGNQNVVTDVTGTGTVGVSGASNTINTSSGTSVTLSNTNGGFDTVNSNGDQANGSAVGGISLGSNTQANVNGGNNEINEATGDSLGVYGGGNIINATSGADLVVGNTSGGFDTVNASGIAAGGTTANGQNTGIWINGDAQANINGNNNNLGVNAGDSVGVYGGGNVISATSGADLVVGNTSGSFDTVNASGVEAGGTTANGQNTGIWINGDAQANINGNDNNLGVNAGDSVGVYGGGNVVNTTAGALVVADGTNGSYDTIN
uniref:beta strand repeat-containing protein n=1 Tax=Burkholderia gladioli TaxID=28095 RepID=UPI003C7A4659